MTARLSKWMNEWMNEWNNTSWTTLDFFNHDKSNSVQESPGLSIASSYFTKSLAVSCTLGLGLTMNLKRFRVSMMLQSQLNKSKQHQTAPTPDQTKFSCSVSNTVEQRFVNKNCLQSLSAENSFETKEGMIDDKCLKYQMPFPLPMDPCYPAYPQHKAKGPSVHRCGCDPKRYWPLSWPPWHWCQRVLPANASGWPTAPPNEASTGARSNFSLWKSWPHRDSKLPVASFKTSSIKLFVCKPNCCSVSAKSTWSLSDTSGKLSKAASLVTMSWPSSSFFTAFSTTSSRFARSWRAAFWDFRRASCDMPLLSAMRTLTPGLDAFIATSSSIRSKVCWSPLSSVMIFNSDARGCRRHEMVKGGRVRWVQYTMGSEITESYHIESNHYRCFSEYKI